MRGVWAVGAVWAALAAPAAAQSPPTLGSPTTISGAEAGYTEVQIPEHLDPFDGTFSLDGGDVIGFVLRYAEPYDKQRPDVMHIRLGRGAHGATMTVAGGGEGLPPGRYRLYLLTTEPGSATLSYGDLDGGPLSLSPTEDAIFDGGTLPPRPSAPNAAVAGRTGPLDGDSITLLRMQLAADALSPGVMELCRYEGGDASAGPLAYTKGCPGGESLYQTAVAFENDGAFSMTFGNGGSTKRGLGGNATFATLAPPLDAIAMWLSFGAERTAPAAPPELPGEENGGGGSPAPAPPPQPPQSGSLGAAPPPEGGSGPPPRGVATLERSRARVRRGRATLRLRCSGPGACTGSVRLGRARPARFAIPGARSATLRARVPRRVRRRMVRRRRAVRVVAAVRSILDGGTIREERTRVRLRRRR